MKPPKALRDAGDDPLLPFVLAARAGDRGAERELLLRVAPVVLALARVARTGSDPKLSVVVIESLFATLKALPTLRGEEPVREVVARITLGKVKLLLGPALVAPDERLLAVGLARARRALRGGDSARIEAWVERALSGETEVGVSRVTLRSGPRSKTLAYIWCGIALALAAFIAYRLLR